LWPKADKRISTTVQARLVVYIIEIVISVGARQEIGEEHVQEKVKFEAGGSNVVLV
jgi:hypothetical protein